MRKIKRIILPTDFSSNANQALRYADLLAHRFDADLTLFHVVALYQDDPNASLDFPQLADFHEKMEASATSQLEKLGSKNDVRVRKITVRGISPADEILNYAHDNDCDLIVMGTHGRSALGHFLIGSVAERVARHARIPVMTVAHLEEKMFEVSDIEKILVPLDFSDFSKQALSRSVQFAQAFGAQLQILHIVDQRIHPAYYVMGEQSIFGIYPDLMERSLKSLREFANEIGNDDLDVEFFVREGNPHEEIVNFAQDQGIDLIVMATHGLSGLERLLIGSTTEKVIRKANAPVLSLKPKD